MPGSEEDILRAWRKVVNAQATGSARATLSLPCGGNDPVMILDEQTLAAPQLQIGGPRVMLEIGPGRHRGRLSVSFPEK